MPYRWTQLPKAPDPSGAFSLAGDTALSLRLRPHHSLPARGFAAFIAVTAALLSVPLLAALGTLVLWALLPFVLAAIAAIWWALRRNARDRQMTEDLTLTQGEITLTRRDPGGQVRSWTANPYWVRVTLHPTGGPVPDYLTLSGDGRDVELGAFLSAEERRQLAGELRAALSCLR